MMYALAHRGPRAMVGKPVDYEEQAGETNETIGEHVHAHYASEVTRSSNCGPGFMARVLEFLAGSTTPTTGSLPSVS